MAKLAYTKHTITGLEGTEGKTAPGVVISMSDKQFAELEALSAVREANEVETQLYQAQKARKPAARKAAVKKPTAPGKKAADKDAGDKDALSEATDTDETDNPDDTLLG